MREEVSAVVVGLCELPCGTGRMRRVWLCGVAVVPPSPAVGLKDNLNTGHTIWFDDNSAQPIADCCQADDGSIYNGYMDGRYRPVDSLERCARPLISPSGVFGSMLLRLLCVSRYRGLPANGTWKLALYDPYMNSVNGTLLAWGVRVHTGPCNRRYRWQKLTPANTGPSPRYDATAVVVDRSMFVFGGRAVGIFDEMWRFDRGACARVFGAT